MHYARSLPNDLSKQRWEPLEKHLAEVAELAGEFAAKFDARKWGELAGWWHDLGAPARPQALRRLGAQLEAKGGRTNFSMMCFIACSTVWS